MKKRLVYFIALLVVLAGAIGPALYMHKVYSSQQQYKQAESSKADDNSVKERDDAAGPGRPAAGTGQTSPEAGKGRPAAEAEQGGPAPDQQNSAPGSASRESTAPPQVSSNSAPAVAPEGGCRVGIAVVGKNGEFLFRAGEVIVKKDNKWGVTALGALDAAGIPYTTMPTWPDFVDSIGGQANSAMAGWMYSVNGEVPMHMADKHPVKTGDKVIWWYSKSMDQPPPQWEDLVREK